MMLFVTLLLSSALLFQTCRSFPYDYLFHHSSSQPRYHHRQQPYQFSPYYTGNGFTNPYYAASPYYPFLPSHPQNFYVDPSEKQFNWDKMSQTLAKKMHEHFLNHFSSEEQAILKSMSFHDDHQAMLTFPIFDDDNDGYITTEEFQGTVKELGQNMPAHEYTKKIDHHDQDFDGAVDFNEYKDMLKQKQENDEPLTEDSDEKKRQQFALFDKDNDGMISPTEVFGVLSNLNFARELSEEDIEQQVEEIMRRHDSDDDGMLTFADMKNIN